MLNLYKSSAFLLFILSLTGCLEVKDSSSDKVVGALEQQNTILQQQTEQNKTSISLTGVVNNLSTDAKAINANVRVKIGSTTSDPVALNAGSFQIDNLPADSNYELVVHSTTNTFLDRVFFGKTRATNSAGKVYQDIGILTVAVGVEHKYKILDSVSNTSIANLKLYANSNSGTASGYEQYLHKSNYDTSTQEYKITIPERMDVSIYANLDLNNDGKAEYTPENNRFGYQALIIEDVDSHNPIHLINLNVNNKVTVRVSILNNLLQPIAGASLNISDSLNGFISGTYDSVTSQYVINGVMDDSLDVLIPAFKSGDTSFSSSTVHIGRPTLAATTYSVSVNGSSYYTSQFTFDAQAEKVFDVVVKPSTYTVYSSLGVIGAVAKMAQSEPQFNVFYTGAVGLKSNSASLVQENVIHIVKGSESGSDLILAGTTLVETIDKPVALDVQSSLNNTLVIAKATTALQAGYSYTFSVGEITDLFSGFDVNLYGDQVSVDVPSSDVFSINNLKLDNDDYFFNGAVIQPSNTAGVVARPSSSYWGSQAVVYLPLSIQTLKTFTLRKEQVTTNGITANDVYTYDIVTNGNVNASKTQAVSLAYNETIVGNPPYSLVLGAAISDGLYYVVNTYEYLQDNNAGATNSITFTYAYETKTGEQATGTITLPVL